MAGQKVCLIVIDGWGMSDVLEGIFLSSSNKSEMVLIQFNFIL